MLTLGRDCLFPAASVSAGGCTGGGPLIPAPSSSKFTESIIPARLDACDVDDAGRTLRAANDSFCGGSGAWSSGDSGLLLSPVVVSPNGPNGSISSPTVSSFVACALILRAPRGFRAFAGRPELRPACWVDCSASIGTFINIVDIEKAGGGYILGPSAPRLVEGDCEGTSVILYR